MLRKEDNDWVKKCMEYDVEVPNKRKTKEDLERGCGKGLSSIKLNKKDAMDCSRWRKLIKDV